MVMLATVLSDARLGVSEARFAAMVERALAEFGGEPDADPQSVLSRDEVAALESVGADLSARRPREADPRTPAVAAYSALLADALTVTDVASRIGIDASRVRHRLAQRRLLGIKQPSGWLLPAYQFGSDGQPLPGLEQVVTRLDATAHPVSVARFFATPMPELVLDRRRQSPRQWLAGGGDPRPVAALAGSLADLP